MKEYLGMTLVKRVHSIALMLTACIGCDQVTKSIARQSLPKSEAISFLNDMFRLQYTENSGAFLSLGANLQADLRYWFFTVSLGLFLAGILVFLITTKQTSSALIIGLSLILAGGVGNLIDRIVNEGRVIDFMNLGIGSLRTGVFNVADIAISIGAVWLLVHSFKQPEKVF
jgi:signal peptidase II